jgi:hypothetical protein
MSPTRNLVQRSSIPTILSPLATRGTLAGMEPVNQARFQLKTTPLLLILVAVGIPIAMQQYKLAAARTSYERLHQAWIGQRVTCEDVVVPVAPPPRPHAARKT